MTAKGVWSLAAAVVSLSLMQLGQSAYAQAAGKQDCGGLVSLKLQNAEIADATPVKANESIVLPGVFGPPTTVNWLPEHCVVHGIANRHKGADGKEYGDSFEIRLPSAWTGRLLFVGGGGLDGILSPAIGFIGPTVTPQTKSALGLGYVVVTTDGGHHGETPLDASFGADPQARADYTSLSTKRVMDVAKTVMESYYGGPAKHTYFMGCSNGGREGMIAGERYPEYFDGIVAGAPAFHLTRAAIAEAWNEIQLASIAPKMPDGRPDLAQSLTPDDMKLLVRAVLDKCDALDGLKDGMIFDPEACHFDPKTVQCSASQQSSCLSAEKVKVVESIFDGPHDSTGHAIYSAWPYDSGDVSEGWRLWMTGTERMPPLNVMIFPPFFNGLALSGVPPPVNLFTFNFDSDTARIDKASAEINATSTDWSRFRARNGKLLLYAGMSDPVFSPLDLIRYYKHMEDANGGATKAHSFARLFLVPGMPHCAGAPGLDDFDTLEAIRAWVEDGKAPDRIIAKGTAFPGRTRPLCPYPLIARYNGSGNPEDSANFSCRKP